MLINTEIYDVLSAGLTLDEYSRIFDLRFTQLKEAAILDAGAGYNSFAAEANSLGLNVKACDLQYGFSADMLEKKHKIIIAKMYEIIHNAKFDAGWDYYKKDLALKANKENTSKLFFEDIRKGNLNRYINTNLPFTIFTDKEFDITLVSNFMFSKEVSLDYYFDCLVELIRITKEEIRIFPIENLYWEKSNLIDTMNKEGQFGKCRFEVKKVDFEIFKGINEYLSVSIL